MLPIPKPPRDIDGKNPWNAHVDLSTYSFGRDGILYKCDVEREWQKFKIVSDEDEKKHYTKSLAMKDKLMTLKGKVDTVSVARKTGYLSMSPPRFGISSRSMKIEKRKWEKAKKTAAMSTAEHNLRDDSLDAGSQIVLDALINNTRRMEETIKPKVTEGNTVEMDKLAATIQAKYEENLRVVEKLFAEKKAMEKKMASMEAEIRRSLTSSSVLTGAGPIPTEEESPAPPSYDELFVEENPQYERGRSRQRRANDSVMDPPSSSSSPSMGLTSSFKKNQDSTTAKNVATFRSRSLSGIRSSPRWNHSRGRARSRSWSRGSDDSEYLQHRERLRALSETRVSGEGLSRSLQADADRYVQRRKAAEEKEWEERQRQLEYEALLEKRFHDAVGRGREFSDMMERSEKAKQTARERAERKKLREAQKQAEEEAKKQLRLQKAMAKAQETQEQYKDLTWEQIQQMEDSKRKERIEARKRQLLAESALPPSLAQSISRMSSKILEQEKPVQFRAEDPEKVAQKLASMQQNWKLKEAKDRQRLLEAKEARKRTLIADERAISSMRQRRESSRSRKDARLQAKKEQEDLKEAQRMEAEKLKKEKLLQAKLPPPTLTKSAELVMEKTLREKEEQQKAEMKARREKEKKDLAMKEHAAALQVIIAEREIERRNNGFVELRDSESFKEAAIQAREEYRRKLRENKKKIRDSLNSRPSLLERHEKSLATKAAASQALQKVAAAVTGGDFSEEKFQSAIDDDDLFGDKEKAILGMTKSAMVEDQRK